MNVPIASRTQIEPTPAWPFALLLRPPVVVVACTVVALLALFAGTAQAIVAIWMRSDTYVHGFVVVPVCLWLAWRERDELAAGTAAPWWPGLVLVGLAGALWTVAALGNVGVLQQFALAFMLQAAIVTVVGKDVGRTLFFPLAFLLFAVPAGEALIPTLIEWTANFTVGALRASGVPVYREGNHFVIPSGAWSVVDACSGVRYLIASTMVGVLFAAVAFNTLRRRALFIAASIAVPIVANWLRAYLIVLLGHLSNNRLAAGVDHLVYGWLFFGGVMLSLLWIGSLWREDALPARQAGNVLRLPRAPGRAIRARPFVIVALLAVAAAGSWRPLEALVATPRSATHGAQVAPVPASVTWPAAAPFVAWKPRYEGYASEVEQAFGHDEAPVGLYIAYYASQERGRELVTSGNLLVPRDDPTWRELDAGDAHGTWDGQAADFARATVKGGDATLAVWHLFWVDGHVTASPYAAKARLAWARLAGRGDAAALVALYTPQGNGDAQARLADFARDMSLPIEASLVAAREATR